MEEGSSLRLGAISRSAMSHDDPEQRLNEFQRETERMLRASLERVGGILEARQVDGVRETYVRARLGGTDLRIFIYDDGAEVSSLPRLHKQSVDDRFERADFRSLPELAAAFVQSAVQRLSEARATGASTGGAPETSL